MHNIKQDRRSTFKNYKHETKNKEDNDRQKFNNIRCTTANNIAKSLNDTYNAN